jgi:lipopolysaccharide/colanic/teichoic acid biosynthesis glycosyltransferase
MGQNHRYYKLQQKIKRTIDLLISIGCLLSLWPLLLLVALAIKLDSPGGAIFRHKRIGKDGQPFNMFKFRSMIACNSDFGYMQYLHQLIESEKEGKDAALPYRKMGDDPRVTRIGKFLRCYYIDELPQLINVFLGEMSLVGPRPHVQIEVDNYTVEQRRRLSVKPGLTGLWQIEGKANCTFSELILMDLEYIDQWSLWLDFKIVLKTFFSFFRGGEKYLLKKRKTTTYDQPKIVKSETEPNLSQKS